MAEKYASLSTYDYVGGNPINRFDPNGMDWYMTETDSSYQYVWVDSQDETTDIDGTTYTNQGNTMSLKYGDRYFHYYQNYMVGSSAREINVMDLVLGNQSTTNQLLNSLDGKYANVLFAQAVNHAINTDGVNTALGTLAIPSSIIVGGELAAAGLLNLNGGAVEFFNQLVANDFDTQKAVMNFNFASLIPGGKYGQWGTLSSMLVKDSNLNKGFSMQNFDAGMVSRGVSSQFVSFTGGQFSNVSGNKATGDFYSALMSIIVNAHNTYK